MLISSNHDSTRVEALKIYKNRIVEAVKKDGDLPV